jgi:hypothetical protein
MERIILNYEEQNWAIGTMIYNILSKYYLEEKTEELRKIMNSYIFDD